MNCANHPERTATAFCQHCGKPLCPECVRSADGLILCEPDLAARQAAGSPAGVQSGSQPGYTPVSGFAGAPAPPPYSGAAASPVLAALLGFIPGVGAMYNGQFVKALIHVVVFIVLIGLTEHFSLASFLIAAWVFYQVFDAAQTAAARRDGRPLPDPFGILDMSQRLGPQGGVPPVGVHSTGYTPTVYPPYPPPGAMPSQPGASAAVPETAVPGSGYAGPYAGPPSHAPGAQAYIPVAQPLPVPPRRGEPIGAIVLIAVGLLFLLSTLGVLNVDWISRGWPLLVLLLGIWLLIRRATAPPPFPPAAPFAPAPQPAPPAPASGSAFAQNPLSIHPRRQEAAVDPQTGPETQPEPTHPHGEDNR